MLNQDESQPDSQHGQTVPHSRISQICLTLFCWLNMLMQHLVWGASQSCGQQVGPSHCAWFAFGFRACATTTSRLSAAGGPVTACGCVLVHAGLPRAATLSGGADRYKNFAPLQERCFTQASQALICQQNCSEVTAANCWKWEQECNYQWEWDMKLVCYFKCGEGCFWCNSKTLKSHINVSYNNKCL